MYVGENKTLEANIQPIMSQDDPVLSTEVRVEPEACAPKAPKVSSIDDAAKQL